MPSLKSMLDLAAILFDKYILKLVWITFFY